MGKGRETGEVGGIALWLLGGQTLLLSVTRNMMSTNHGGVLHNAIKILILRCAVSAVDPRRRRRRM